jgi:tryptophan 2,3-dioxygenase
MTVKVKKFIVDGVETFEANINGESIQWDKGLSYNKHLQTKTLLSCQVPVSDEPEELMFIIIHQSMELWIKQCIHEAKMLVKFIQSNQLPRAFKTLDRIAVILRHMINSWEILATLTPNDFLTFRGYLQKASGFQSYQYRELEFLLGNKNKGLIIVHKDDESVYNHLFEILKTPSLYDVTLKFLADSGYDVPGKCLDRDFSEPYVAAIEIEAIWKEIYSNADNNWELFMLGEKLTALEYYFQEWRFKHMKTVSRVIGHKTGTGGSSGVNYLVKALDNSFFPELWSMRSQMMGPM